MKYLFFVTDEPIDLRCFTTFGVNAKPNTTSPIGFFGTGLKMATAVVARLGGEMKVLIDGVLHRIETEDGLLREKNFKFICMKTDTDKIDLPFTTELARNWEPWQAFREFEANTRDEKGITHPLFVESLEKFFQANSAMYAGKTVIAINCQEIIAEYEQKDTIFLFDSLEYAHADKRCEAFLQQSDYLFYRGMRVMKLPRPSKFTYNLISHQRLTEDRTLYNFDAFWELKNFIIKSENKEFLTEILNIDPSEYWEGSLPFDENSGIEMSDTFKNLCYDFIHSGNQLPSRIKNLYLNSTVNAETYIHMKNSTWLLINEFLKRCENTDLLNQHEWDACEKLIYNIQALVPQPSVQDELNDEIPF